MMFPFFQCECLNILTLEKSAVLNRLTHRQKKAKHRIAINKRHMSGVITNPWISNATPAFTRAETGKPSMCRAIYLNAAVV